eukprot:g1739.t1
MPRHFDLLVLGGGSGGIATARRAAMHGARVAVVEMKKALGGTCVNVGCVPKKVMYNAAATMEALHQAPEFGFSNMSDAIRFDWGELKRRRDAYVSRLNGIYERNLEGSDVRRIYGHASFVDDRKILVRNDDDDDDDVTITADHVLVTTGGKPDIPEDCPGASLGITSDGFFDLPELPKRAAVVGAGYIAVELAGILNALGTDTTLVLRKNGVLRQFDPMVSRAVEDSLVDSGVTVVRNSEGVSAVESDPVDGLLTLEPLDPANCTEGIGKNNAFDTLVWAVGRSPLVEGLGLESAGIETTSRGHIVVNEFAETSAPNTYAIGDVCGKWELTPVAIAAGRILADRLFGEGKPNCGPRRKMDYADIPTVVFSHPPTGTVGMTEPEAVEAFGADAVRAYSSTFVNLHYGTFDVPPSEKPKTFMKLVCVGEEERVVGLHAVGMAADEMLQGFAVAVRMGATKADFDSCVAIHPTAAEEFVTLAPWGTTPLSAAKERA